MKSEKEYWEEVRRQIRKMRQQERRQDAGREADLLAASAEGGDRAVD